MPTGRVKIVKADRGFGFIKTDEGQEIFFHAADCEPTLPFDENLKGKRVEYTVQPTEKGDRAVGVRIA